MLATSVVYCCGLDYMEVNVALTSLSQAVSFQRKCNIASYPCMERSNILLKYLILQNVSNPAKCMQAARHIQNYDVRCERHVQICQDRWKSSVITVLKDPVNTVFRDWQKQLIPKVLAIMLCTSFSKAIVFPGLPPFDPRCPCSFPHVSTHPRFE